MAKALSFSTGVREYDLNGTSVYFNPTDESFIARIERTYDKLEELTKAKPKSNSFAEFEKLDESIRAELDGLLGEGVSDSLFGPVNSFAMVDGLPLWANVLVVVLEECWAEFEHEAERTEGRAKEHMAKYDKIMARYRKGKK